MKTRDQIKPHYAPVYCAAMYPALCYIFQRHGYALAVHGSMARDFDLIAVPWTEDAATPETVIAAIAADGLAVRIDGEPERKPHGRLAYTMSVGFGECACDLSFMPNASVRGGAAAPYPARGVASDFEGNVSERTPATSAGRDADGTGGEADIGRTTAAPLPSSNATLTGPQGPEKGQP